MFKKIMLTLALLAFNTSVWAASQEPDLEGVYQAIKTDTCDKYLNLSHHAIDASQAGELGKALACNKCAIELSLICNSDIGNEGFKSLLTGLVSNTNLRTLDMTCTGLNDDKIILEAVTDFATQNKTLKRIFLDNNALTEETQQKVAQILKDGPVQKEVPLETKQKEAEEEEYSLSAFQNPEDDEDVISLFNLIQSYNP